MYIGMFNWPAGVVIISSDYDAYGQDLPGGYRVTNAADPEHALTVSTHGLFYYAVTADWNGDTSPGR